MSAAPSVLSNRGVSSTTSLRSAQWKSMMERGLFDDFYPHRLNACFQYLDNDALNCFSLKDLISRGKFVFKYLGLALAEDEEDGSFAIMDRFRALDRSGRGTVSMEEFVMWMLQYLHSLHSDHHPLPDDSPSATTTTTAAITTATATAASSSGAAATSTASALSRDGRPAAAARCSEKLLSRAAAELLTADDRVPELLAKLDKGALLDATRLPLFSARLRFLSYAFRDQLRERRNSNQPINLKLPGLVRILKQSVLSVISDTQQFFRIAPERLFWNKLSATTAGTGVSATGPNSNSKLQLSHPLACSVWNIAGVRRVALAAASGANGATLTQQQRQQQQQHGHSHQRSAGVTTASSSVNERDHYSDDAGNALYAAAAAAESTDGRSFRSSREHRSDHNSHHHRASHPTAAGAGAASSKSAAAVGALRKGSIHHSSTGGGSSGDHAVEDITTTAAAAAAGFSGGSGVDADLLDSIRGLQGIMAAGPDSSNQLHLLQAAFRSLNNFFALSRSAPGQQQQQQQRSLQSSSTTSSAVAAAAIGGSAMDAPLSPAARQSLAVSVQRREAGGPLRLNHEYTAAAVSSVHSTLLSDSTSTIPLSNQQQQQQQQQQQHPSAATTTAVSSRAAAELRSGVEFELAQRLFESQEELRRMRARMEILEMVQEEAVIAVANNSRNTFVDEADPPGISSSSIADQRLWRPLDSNDNSNSYSNGFNGSSNSSGNNNNNNGSSGGGIENVAALGDGGGWFSAPPVMSFDGIMSELTALRVCLSERASSDFPMGFFLETPVAVIAAPAVEVLTSANDDGNSSDSSDDASSKGGSTHRLNINSSGDKNSNSNSSGCNSNSGVVAGAGSQGVAQTLSTMRKLAGKLLRMNQRKSQLHLADEQLLSELRRQQESLAEYKALLELGELDRSEFVALNIELQMLREKNQRLQQEVAQHRAMSQQQQQEHSRRVRNIETRNSELQQQLKQATDGDGATTIAEGQSTAASDNRSSSNGSGSRRNDALLRLQDAEHQKDLQSAEIERLRKENQRLKSAIAVSEQRLKGTLQDQVMLQQQLQQMEEDTMNAKAAVTMLTRELEEVQLSRGFREEADRSVSQLRREVHKRDIELAEAREEAALAGKYLAELQQAEKTIEELESNISDVTVELEKGAVATHQLDNYREQLRSKTREMRDMALHIHSLEAELKDMLYLQNRFAEISEELDECRMKCEKLPALLSEQARLRGSSRASVKALNEQDKALHHLKSSLKELQRECAMLRNENRAMQELEVKLKEANQEIQRLMKKVSEVQLLQAGVRNAQEEKKSIEGQYKKMRKFIRQSAIANGLPAATTSANSFTSSSAPTTTAAVSGSDSGRN